MSIAIFLNVNAVRRRQHDVYPFCVRAGLLCILLSSYRYWAVA